MLQETIHQVDVASGTNKPVTLDRLPHTQVHLTLPGCRPYKHSPPAQPEMVPATPTPLHQDSQAPRCAFVPTAQASVQEAGDTDHEGRLTDNVLNALPKSAQPDAKASLAEIWNAEDREHAQQAATAFAQTYGAKWPKATAKITDDLDVLLEFYNYPAEHWIHLRTTNPIESTFATVRLRQRVTKGPGSRAAGVAMAFKLIESAQRRWRAVNAPHLVALVRAGAVFERGVLVERPDHKSGGDQQVA